MNRALLFPLALAATLLTACGSSVPSTPSVRGACGLDPRFAPVVPVKLIKLVWTPAGVILKIVPKLLAPPVEVVP